ncbi:MAG: protein-export membrane protein SecD [Deltaproteobacteria bacterium RIFCSPLOWO2_12_FULL_38_8]|nr:MAG: protein-export membrane protein SecD [Deltaproteobacteria bacterium RIFCSPLOWO2_12_FULL_38_8]
MSRKWWTKFAFVCVLVLLSIAGIVGSVYDIKKLPSWIRVILPDQKLKLGLDLQGGLHIVMGIDPQKVLNEGADLLAQDLKEDLLKVSPGIQVTREKGNADIRVQFSNTEDVKEIRKKIRSRYGIFEFVKQGPNELILGFSTQEKNYRIKRAIDQSIEAIRNRIDELGVSEPSIQSEGTDRIVVQLPGVQDTERAKDIIGRTAKLEFKLVDTTKSPAELLALVAQIEKEKNIQYVAGAGAKFSTYLAQINEAISGKIPADDEIAFQRQIDPQTQKVTWIPYLLKKKADVTGDYIRDARVGRDQQTNEPLVLFQLNANGTKPFAELTEKNVGGFLAIVLDGIVHSAPQIKSKIPNGEGQITLGAGDDVNKMFKEAQDTALVLRAGALPTTIELLEERTVGPSLGADSIESGKKAILIGTLAIILFMIFYYKLSGIIAAVALLLNFPFILSIMAAFGATLTLPGLAGLILTVGMAVDANVLIFERIREEIRLNKTPRTSIEMGFEKAWGTIFDANVTTLVTALALFAEGTGPIKGFAVTLSIGICCSVFTAVYISRLCFEFLLDKINISKVSI